MDIKKEIENLGTNSITWADFKKIIIKYFSNYKFREEDIHSKTNSSVWFYSKSNVNGAIYFYIESLGKVIPVVMGGRGEPFFIEPQVILKSYKGYRTICKIKLGEYIKLYEENGQELFNDYYLQNDKKINRHIFKLDELIFDNCNNLGKDNINEIAEKISLIINILKEMNIKIDNSKEEKKRLFYKNKLAE